MFWYGLLRDPRQVPPVLALAAVQSLGPHADRYARWLRATYPDVPPDALARHALLRATSAAPGAGALAALVRPLGDLLATGWLSTRVVLDIAAAYGLDACDPERAAELLVLTGFATDLAAARRSLSAVTEPAIAWSPDATARPDGTPAADDAPASVPPGLPRSTRLGGAGGWLVARALAGRFLPGAVPLIAAGRLTASTEALAWRACQWYRKRSMPS